MNHQPEIIVVLGPTASGKSDFAVEFALKHNGEIISADSRQVYKGLDIGTGKITKEEMNGIPHYMLSVYELDDEVSVASYARDAMPILNDILSRGKTPIICGGTGQYIDALIFDTTIPEVAPNIKLREELEKKSSQELYEKLHSLDPRRGDSIDTHNRVRLIRALEIVESLGAVPTQVTPTLRFPTTIYLMSPTREKLRERITKRLEARLEMGMIDEVKDIMEKVQSIYGKASFQEVNLEVQNLVVRNMGRYGLEYVAIAKYIEGISTEQEMKQEIITKSMHYVKRQETWNKKYKSIEACEGVPPVTFYSVNSN